MSKQKAPKKKKTVSPKKTKTVVNPQNKKVVSTSTKKKLAPTTSKSKVAATPTTRQELVVGKGTYLWMGIGIGLILLGMLLMIGGAMPDKDTWDESLIYSFRTTVLAPIVILLGLSIEIYAIFKK